MKKITDGKIIIALCCLVAVAGVGISNCVGVFTVPICTDLQLPQSTYALTSTIFNVVSAIVTLFTPKFMFKYTLKKTVLLGAIFNGGGYMALSLCNNIYLMYVLNVITGVGYALICMTTLFIIINSYYPEKNGIATSIVMSFTGLAGTIISPLLASIIEKTDWQMGYIVSGVLTIVLCIPMYVLADKIEIVKSRKADLIKESKEPKDNKLFIVLLCVSFFMALYQCALIQFLPSLANDYGMNPTQASLTLSLAMIGNIVFKLADGFLTDYIGTMPTNTLMYIINMLAAFVFVINTSDKILIINSFAYGAIYGVSGMGMSFVVKYLFSNEGVARIYPIIALFGTAGYGISSVVIGAIYDAAGNYDLAMILSFIFGIIMTAISIYIDIQSRKQKKTDMH